jgi:hypothetical protein
MPDFQLVTSLHSNISVADVEVGDRLPSIAGARFQLVYADSGEPVDASAAKASADLELWKAGERLLTLEGFFAPTVEAEYAYSCSLRAEDDGGVSGFQYVSELPGIQSESGFSWLKTMKEALGTDSLEPLLDAASSELTEWTADGALVFDPEPVSKDSTIFVQGSLENPLQLSVTPSVNKIANTAKR